MVFIVFFFGLIDKNIKQAALNPDFLKAYYNDLDENILKTHVQRGP